MRSALRQTRSFSLDPELLSEVERTKGRDSASERVNSLLKRALELERRVALRAEAAEFFANHRENATERRAFQKATVKTWS